MATYTQRQYTQSDSVKKLREELDALNTTKPNSYASKWQPQLDDTVNQILNRKDFNYDVNADALYQQYADQYITQGRKAMMDTLGMASTLTGGYGNSYAQIAGQQAYQGYLQGLTDKIPELYQLAYDRYNQQGQDLYNKYGLLGAQEEADYNRWLSQYDQWLNERDYQTGRYDTELGYDYGMYRDAVGDDQWLAEYNEALRQFDFANKLGEFAPVTSSGGGSGDGSDYSPGKQPPKEGPETDPTQLSDGGQKFMNNLPSANAKDVTGATWKNHVKTGLQAAKEAGTITDNDAVLIMKKLNLV